MRIAVLGPLEVLRDDSAPVEVPGRAERLLLAALAAHVPDPVSSDQLIGILGEGSSAESARASLQDHIRDLRRSLDPGLGERSSGQYVLRRGQGYALAVNRGDVDALHAADLVARGRARLVEGEAAEAVRLLSAALALWRGEPFGEWPEAAFAHEERRRLAAVRAGAEASLSQAHVLLARQADAGAPPRRRGTGLPLPVDRAPDEAAHPAASAVVSPPVRSPVPAATSPHHEGPVVPRATVETPPLERPGDERPGDDRAEDGGRPLRNAGRWAGFLAAGVVVALLVTGLTARSAGLARSDRDATAAAADRLAARSADEAPLDVSLLLAAQAFRLADTSRTRDALRTVLVAHRRAERVVAFDGSPLAPVLTGGGRTLVFGAHGHVMAWPVGPRTEPEVLMALPAELAGWLVVAGSPTDDVVLAAGGADGQQWIRSVSAVDGSTRVLAGGEAIWGRPIDGAVTADGRRFLLVVARPDAELPADVTRWRLIDVDVIDGTSRDTSVGGVIRGPVHGLRADFSDDAASFVLWNDAGTAAATIVDVADGRQTPIQETRGPAARAGFGATPAGAVQLWGDGTVSLVDRNGITVQWLYLHTPLVRDVVTSPDGTWAATAGDGGEVVRWDVDPVTGLWSSPQFLTGHHGAVVGAEVHGDGDRLFSVSVDGRVIVWDMRAAGGLDATRSLRPDSVPASVWLEDACAVVGRDFTPGEWRRYLPDRPFRPTCTDLH